jgi:hypothetical protein
MRRPRHENRAIETALQHAERAGWAVVVGRGHCWGLIRCPHNDVTCRGGQYCQSSIWGTPRVPENEVRKIMRAVDGCMFRRDRPDDDPEG